jgi:hypothetical protein
MIARFRRALLRLFGAEPRDMGPALAEMHRFSAAVQRLAAPRDAEAGR